MRSREDIMRDVREIRDKAASLSKAKPSIFLNNTRAEMLAKVHMLKAEVEKTFPGSMTEITPDRFALNTALNMTRALVSVIPTATNSVFKSNIARLVFVNKEMKGIDMDPEQGGPKSRPGHN